MWSVDFRPTRAVWLWSCLGSVFVTIIIEFVWIGVVTEGWAEVMAEKAAETARLDVYATFCADRFNSDAGVMQEIDALRRVRRWEQGNFLKAGGWVKTPGLAGHVDDIATLCVKKILERNTPMTVSSHSVTSTHL
jgi:hypothetical protein